jgi:outer membrane protein
MKKIYITFVCLFFAGALYAQSNTAITYSMGFTSGDLSDYIQKASFRGMTIDYHKMVNPNIGVGVSFGWNVFYEAKPYDTYTVDNVSLSGKQWRYSNHFPMLLSAGYYLKPGETVNPYVGLGAGTIYTLRNTDMNLYTLEQEAWNFALQPEVGFNYSIDDATGVTVRAKYYYGFAAGSDLDTPQSYFALNVGFVFMK